MALESDSDDPDKAPIFSKYPEFLKDHHALAFVCDSMRMASSGGIEPFDADQMMETDMDVHHHEATSRSPRSHHGRFPARSGHRRRRARRRHHHGRARRASRRDRAQVAAALVGTFLEFCCATAWSARCLNMAKSRGRRTRLLSGAAGDDRGFMKGTAPTVAVEFARRAIPAHVRPTFQEREKSCRGKRRARRGGRRAPE